MTSDVSINDVEFAFAQTAVENMYQSEFDIKYVICPVWKFNVQLNEEVNTIDGSVLYDATTGERVGYQTPEVIFGNGAMIIFTKQMEVDGT